MGFIVIKGTFHATGYRPDGDSIKFKAANKKLWSKLTTNDGGKATIILNKKDMAQLRIEAIDALETHYIAGGMLHQPEDMAGKSRENLLKLAGIKDVVWGESGTEVTSSKDGVEGYILTRYVDNNRYGRPVSFAFAGKTNLKDGAEVFLTVEMIKKSMNYKQLVDGMAYPTFYTTFFWDLRKAFSEATIKARNAKRGIWKLDTSKGFIYNNIESITDEHVIFPKLFRRLAEHMNKNEGKLSDFRKFLDAKKDAVYIVDKAQTTDSMDMIITVKGKRVSLTTNPENILFVPQP